MNDLLIENKEEHKVVNKWYKSSKLRIGYTKWHSLLLFFIVSTVITDIDNSIFGSNLMIIEKFFRLNPTQGQWLGSISILATSVGAIPLTNIGKKIGFVTMQVALLASLGIFYIATYFISSSWSFSYIIILIARFLEGFVLSGIQCIENAMILVYPAQSEVPMAMKKYGTTQTVLTMLITFCATALQNFLSWNTMVLIAAGFCFLSIILVIPYENYRGEAKNFDLFGMLSIAVACGSLSLLITTLSLSWWITSAVVGVVLVISIILFYQIEKRHANPILPLKMFTSPIIDLVILMVLTNIAYSTSQIFPIQEGVPLYGLTPLFLSLIIVMIGVLGIISTVVANTLTHFVVYRFGISLSCFLCSLITVLFGLLLTTSLAWMMVNIGLFFLMSGLTIPMLTQSLLQVLPAQFSTALVSLNSIGSTLGMVLGTSLVMGVVDLVQQFTGQEYLGWSIDEYWSSVVLFICAILAQYRIGNFKYERGKKLFNEKAIKVIGIQFEQQEEGGGYTAEGEGEKDDKKIEQENKQIDEEEQQIETIKQEGKPEKEQEGNNVVEGGGILI